MPVTPTIPTATLDRLAHLREGIDRADASLVALLGERQRLARAVGRVKAEAGLPVIDAEREGAVAAGYAELAARHGLDPVIVAHLARVVIQMARAVQGGVAEGPVAARQVA